MQALAQKLKSLTDELEAEKHRVRELQSQVNTLTHSNGELHAQVANLSENNRDLAQENEKLRHELSQAESALQQHHNTYNHADEVSLVEEK